VNEHKQILEIQENCKVLFSIQSSV